ncbi:MAG: hypothetical protein N5P05_003743 [Chroococcopsis gigantea SAG 12.99]|jgi:hypothetical protein|nr:hypothetical protein [Chroococcopsis gigantea SAG 12.99]
MMQLAGLILLGVYGWGVWQFWKGFTRTNYQPTLTNRLGLALLWPALLAMSKPYRKNFQKALRGR